MSLIWGKNRKKGPYYDSDWDEPFVRFECGHESQDTSVVMALYRRVKAGIGVGLCIECETKRRKEQRKESAEHKTLESVAASLEDGLSPIVGSSEQVAWAERLRGELFRIIRKEESFLLHKLYSKEERAEGHEVVDAVLAELKEQTAARWWIEAAHRDAPARRAAQLYDEALARLRSIEDARFGPVSCSHEGAMHPFGPRRKLLCYGCLHDANVDLGLNNTPMENLSVAGHIKAGLPVLEGSEKQVTWAEKIRDRFFHELLRVEKQNPEESAILRRVCREVLRQSKARWWIDQPNRDEPLSLYTELRDSLKEKNELPVHEAPQEPAPILSLAPLEGSEKQVAWATRIRQRFFQANFKGLPARGPVEKSINEEVAQQTKAKWWIDHSADDDPEVFYQRLLEELRLREVLQRDLPVLEGSEKQVAWATTIRQRFFLELTQRRKSCTSKKQKNALDALEQEVKPNAAASWWIGAVWRDNPAQRIDEALSGAVKK